MEEEATKIMSSYCAGDYKAVEAAFKQMDAKLVKHAVERARYLGNAAFAMGAYRQAVQYYNEAMAGEEDSQKHSLLSNRSACCLLLREYEKALEDARMCIRIAPTYAKGWYRAARVLFETGKFSGAEAAFRASRKHEAHEGKQKELDVWIEKAHRHAHKAKLIDRVTVDYSRFDNIGDSEITSEADTMAGGVPEDVCNIEFSDELSTEQRRQLELFLTGKVETPSSADQKARLIPYSPSTVYSEIPCYAELLLREGPRVAAKCQTVSKGGGKLAEKYKAKRIALEAPVALCKFLQLVTEVREPKKLADSLEGAIQLHFATALQSFIKGYFQNSSGSCPKNISWLFLGCGTCVPLVTAARLLDESLSPSAVSSKTSTGVPRCAAGSVASRVVERIGTFNSSNSLVEESSTPQRSPDVEKTSNYKPITACTIFLSTPLRAAAERMLENNKVVHLVNLVQQSPYKMECAGESADELDYVTKDMTEPAQLLVIDPSLLDEALIGRQVIPYVRRARTHLCVPQPTVFPSSATVFVQAFSIHLPKQKTTFDWAAVETAARWSPYAEAMCVTVLPGSRDTPQDTRAWQYGDDVTGLSQIQAAFTFDFDGSLDQLDQDLPLEGTKELDFVCTESGILNALVVWYQLRGPPQCSTAVGIKHDPLTTSTTAASSLIVDCAPVMGVEEETCLVASRSANLEPLRLRTIGSITQAENLCRPKQAVFWMDPIFVEKGQILKVHASHSASRLRLKIVSPRESPFRTHRLAIPRYHLDLLRDPRLLELYQQAIARVAAAQLKKSRHRSKKYEHFNKQASAAEFPPPPCLSLLCVGGAPAPLPMLAGHAVAAEIVKAAGCAASTWQRKQANLQAFHVTVADSWPSATRVCKQALLDNAHLLLEPYLAPSLPIPKDEKWKPIAELTAHQHVDSLAPVASNVSKDAYVVKDWHGSTCIEAANSMGEKPKKTPICPSLLKTKIKTRFTCVQKDVRQLKPPSGEEDTTSLLTLAEIYRLPPGADVKAHLEQAENMEQTEAAACRLSSLASICVCGLFDNGFLGEGVLPLSKFIARVLLVKGRATLLPRRARAFAVLLELGKQDIHDVNVEIWRTYRYLPDYWGINLDEETFKLLSDPFLAWDFDLSPTSLADISSPLFAKEKKDISVTVTQEGEINAVAFWFELDVDESLTISTAPTFALLLHGDSRRSSEGANVTSESRSTLQAGVCFASKDRTQSADQVHATGEEPTRHIFHRTKAWKQAVQMQSPLNVAAGCTVVVGAAHDSTKMLFRVDALNEGISLKNSRPLCDPSWTSLFEKQRELSAGWMKALCGAGDNQYTAYVEQAMKAALCIAADVGRQSSYRIDPQEAAAFALTLFY